MRRMRERGLSERLLPAPAEPPRARVTATWWRRLVAWLIRANPIERFCSACESRMSPDPMVVCVFCAILDASEAAAVSGVLSGYRRPARTGYIDELRVYHPAPDDVVAFDDHADHCARCRCERNRPRASRYVGRDSVPNDRAVHIAAARRAITGRPAAMPIPGPGRPRLG